MKESSIDNLLRHLNKIGCEKCNYTLLTKTGDLTTMNLALLTGVVTKDDGNKIIFITCPNCGNINELLMEYEDE